MTSAGADGGLDAYTAAWKALPRRERAELAQAATRGRPAANRWDAALQLWWTQRELRRGPWAGLLLAGVMILALLVLWWAATGAPPTSIGDVFEVSPLLPVLLLIPIAATSLRRPRLRLSAQLNAGVLTGRTFEAPPDAEETERLLARARTKGWFRGSRPDR